jgi:hypothetical protein
MGGVFGVAIYTAVINSQLGASASAPEIKSLPIEEQAHVIKLFAEAFHNAFLYGIPVCGVGFLICIFLKHIPLRKAPVAKDAQPNEQDMLPSAVLEM